MILTEIKRCFDYSGRSSRKEYWSFVLFWFLLYQSIFVLTILFESIFEDIPKIFILIQLLTGLIFIPVWLSSAMRRLNDVGAPRIFLFIPIYNLYLLCQPSKEFGRMPARKWAEYVPLAIIIYASPIIILELFLSPSQLPEKAPLLFFVALYFAMRWLNKKVN